MPAKAKLIARAPRLLRSAEQHRHSTKQVIRVHQEWCAIVAHAPIKLAIERPGHCYAPADFAGFVGRGDGSK